MTPEGRLTHVEGAWNIGSHLILNRTLAGITGLILRVAKTESDLPGDITVVGIGIRICV